MNEGIKRKLTEYITTISSSLQKTKLYFRLAIEVGKREGKLNKFHRGFFLATTNVYVEMAVIELVKVFESRRNSDSFTLVSLLNFINSNIDNFDLIESSKNNLITQTSKAITKLTGLNSMVSEFINYRDKRVAHNDKQLEIQRFSESMTQNNEMLISLGFEIVNNINRTLLDTEVHEDFVEFIDNNYSFLDNLMIKPIAYNSTTVVFPKQHVLHELHLLIGASKIVKYCEDRSGNFISGNTINYFKDSVYLHTRNLYTFLYKISDKCLSMDEYNEKWREPLNNFVTHLYDDNRRSDGTNIVNNKQLNEQTHFFVKDILRLFDDLKKLKPEYEITINEILNISEERSTNDLNSFIKILCMNQK